MMGVGWVGVGIRNRVNPEGGKLVLRPMIEVAFGRFRPYVPIKRIAHPQHSRITVQ